MGRKAPEIIFIDGENGRQCPVCKIDKKFTEFNKSKIGFMGYQSICRQCSKEQMAKEGIKQHNLNQRYGISETDYNILYLKQEGKCKICNNFEEVLRVDHNHETKIIRGLLCHSCNLGIGHLNDDPILLQKALDYLLGDK